MTTKQVQADEAREKMEIAAEVAEDAAKAAGLKLHGNAVSGTQGESPIGRRPSLLAMQSLGSRKNVFRAFLGGGSNSGAGIHSRASAIRSNAAIASCPPFPKHPRNIILALNYHTALPYNAKVRTM